MSRSDRIAQMSLQESLIAKKKQQILEKQQTAELAKAIAAASNKSKSSSSSKVEKEAEAQGSMKNTFNNDGSFLENFKKFTDQAFRTRSPDKQTTKREAEDEIANSDKKLKLDVSSSNVIHNTLPPPPPPPLSLCGPSSSTYNHVFDPNVPPPLKVFHLNYPPLHTISPPKPLELNTIPPPKEFDLSAIPKPILNVELIKIPEVGANYKVLSENDKLPTTVEQLVELVAEIGDVYEEKLCSRKNDLHPTFWFLFDKQSEAYKNYRHMIVVRNLKNADNGSSKYDPADILDDKEEEMRAAQQQILDEARFYEDNSTTESDSDTEYMKEAKERNLKNLKRKTLNVGQRKEDSSTDSDDDDTHDSNHEAYDNIRKEAILNRQKHKKKSRWGENLSEINCLNKVPSTLASTSNLKTDPAFLQFVFESSGTIEIDDDNWKKAEAHYHLKQLYQDMSEKIQEHEKSISNRLVNKDKYKYDSEEDRQMNSNKMKAILLWMSELTKLYEAHASKDMSDFLMPDEFRKFMEKFAIAKANRDPDFEDYKKYKLEQSKVIATNHRAESSTDSDYFHFVNKNAACENGDDKNRGKPRKSRWGDQVEIKTVINPSIPATTTLGTNQPKPLLTLVTRTDPALLQYARQNFGTIELSEEDWKKAEEHFKINLLYQDMLKKRQEIDRLASSGKFKYEYDSDEDVNGGTWEHKLRSQEMEATQLWASALNKQSEGRHHIGDFLPPEELKKFMEKYDAQKTNRQPNLSDYKEYKLKEDNVGFQMLQKLGWKEGQGLGASGSGIVDPVNKAAQRDNNQGLGVMSADNPELDDNEYDAYRKRMMLAYRFRPNPLNNPRRAYY